MAFLGTFFGTSEKQNEALFSQLFTHTPMPTIVTDDHGKILLANKSFSEITDYTAEELTGERISLLKSGRHDHTFYEQMWEKLSEHGHYAGEIWNRNKDQSLRLFKVAIVKMVHQQKDYFIGSYQDITEERKLNDRFQHLATHDALTGLANRTLAKDRFLHALLNALRANEKVGLLLCDLNAFKEVNDVYGHSMGDRVLQSAAEKLRSTVRESDTVARFGGDEFLVITERLQNENELTKLVKKLYQLSTVTVEADGKTIQVPMSVGHACFPSDGTTYEQLLEVADNRMYNQKKRYYGHE